MKIRRNVEVFVILGKGMQQKVKKERAEELSNWFLLALFVQPDQKFDRFW
jgi:hypothetical protein